VPCRPARWTRRTPPCATANPPASPGCTQIQAGQTLRILDLEGNQAVDVIFYNRHDRRALQRHRHDAGPGRHLPQHRLGAASNEGRPMLTIVADTCGRHDTPGACAAESNTVRYALQKKFMHSCRDNYPLAIAQVDAWSKRDLVPNINFFMNVPVTPTAAQFDDGVSAPASTWSCAPRWTCGCWCPTARSSTTPATPTTPRRCEFLIWDGA
jgi:uncharacterized protein YcgI (DUF1989 family)